MSNKQPQPVPITDLPVSRLQQVLAQVEERCNNWADSAAQLNGALQRYEETYESLNHLGPRSEGKELLVPLSESLYAVGALEDSDSVLIEIGTGYFVNKTIVEAQAFLQRKMDYLKKNIAEISKKLDEDVRNLEQVSLVIRQKGGQI